MALRTDPARLSQVVVNLLSNAIKYNRPGGSVQLHCRLVSNRVLICVRDTGQGMTTEQRSRLFQPFERLGRETSAVEGTGIGLFITKRVVELLGGEIHVDSTEGVGTQVTIGLPYVPAAGHPTELNVTQYGVLTNSEPLHGTVLYVEDDPVNALLVQQWFRAHTELVVKVADTCAAGRQAAVELQPDLIVLDMQLPDQHGLQCLRALKADPRTAGIQVIALSGNAMLEEVAAAKAAGAAEYWVKPVVDHSGFTAVVAMYVRRRRLTASFDVKGGG